MKAWVISGGGARIIQAQLTIEQYLEDGGELPDIIVGTSAGGLLAFLISHLGVDGAREEIFKIRKRRDIFQGFAFFGPFTSGLWHSKPLQKIMQNVQARSKPGIPTWVCSFDTYSMQKTYFNIANSKPEALASTACIPFLVEPTMDRFVDGGVVENTPLKQAIDLGATEITVIMCSAEEKPKEKYVNGKLEMLLRVFEAQRLEIALDDLRVCETKNELGRTPIAVQLLAPKRNALEILEFNQMRAVYKALR